MGLPIAYAGSEVPSYEPLTLNQSVLPAAASDEAAVDPDNSAAAPGWPAQDRDHWEFTIGPGAVANSDINAGSFSGNIGLGYFLPRNFELSLRETFFYSSFPNGTNWMSLTRIALDYQLNFGRWHPFFGPQVGYGVGIHNTSSFELGGDVGLKYDLSRNVSAYGSIEYDKFLRHRPFKTGIREDALIIAAGVSIHW